MKMESLFVSCAVLSIGACSGGHVETHAVGSISYHAAPTSCQLQGNDGGALEVLTDHYQATDGRGLVFKALKSGAATIKCGDEKTTVKVREAAKIELLRVDGESKAVAVDELYAPGFCIRALDKKGKQLKVGRFTEGIEFTVSDHLRSISSHGMGGPGPGAACLSEHGPDKAGTAKIAVSWKGMVADASLEIEK